VAARIGNDQPIVAHKLIASCMLPIFVAAASAMQKQQRFPIAVQLLEHFDAIDGTSPGFHGAHCDGNRATKQASR
jgi:hypothetical protein